MELKKALPIVTVALVVIAGVFLGIATAIQNLDMATVPEGLKELVGFLQKTFTAGYIAAGLIWLRGLSGYIEAKAQARIEGNTEIEYDFNKFYKTTAYYLGNVAIIFNAAPTPELRAIGTAVIFFIDLLYSVLKRVFAK